MSKGELAELQVLLRAASGALPNLAAATVSKSLEWWQDWADVNATRLVGSNANSTGPVVLRALRVQGDLWHQLLTVETIGENEEDPGAIRVAALRRLRPILIAAVLTAIVIYLTVTHLSGAAKAWTIIVTITAALGITGTSLLSAARRAANAFGWSQQTTAKAEARVWSVTILPALPQGWIQRSELARRGVDYRTVHKGLAVTRDVLEAIKVAEKPPGDPDRYAPKPPT